MLPSLRFVLALGAVATVLAACSSSSTSTSPSTDAGGPGEDASPTTDGGAGVDASPSDAAPDAPVITGKCADTFGSALTEGFGRLDGVVYAVQKPSDTQCVMPNSDHVVLQVLWNGAVYRMVVNVQGSGADTQVRFGAFPRALPAPAFAEGWHAGVALDYVTTLGVHSTDAAFAPSTANDLVAAIAKEIAPGDPVSVYATSGAGRPESAHLVHRNVTNQDGAIVVSPRTSPKLLLFHFANQTF
jgi:hypothetical protein